jgi:diacylglycerol kinase family enzyme
VVQTPFVFVGNNEYQLDGLELGARRTLDAGALHVCLAPDMTRSGVARMIAAALARRLSTVRNLESHLIDAFSIEAGRRQLLVSFDGEVAVLPVPLEYRSVPGALRVLVPGAADAPRQED